MDVDSDSLKYLKDLIRDVDQSTECEYLLRLAVEHHIECCDIQSLKNIAEHVLSLCNKTMEKQLDAV